MFKFVFFWFFFISLSYSRFIPKNNFMIHNIKDDLKISSKYHSLGLKIIKLFSDELYELNSSINLKFDFSNPAVNAFARQDSSQIWGITFFGGLLRHELMNEALFSGILCHEIGHHLGGEPKKKYRNWSSVEGQADYFTTQTCLKKVLNQSLLEDFKYKIKGAKEICNKINVKDCVKLLKISQMMADFSHKLKNSRRGPRDSKAKLTKRDKKRVNTTLEAHQSSQCRLDTFVEGVVCQSYLSGDLHCNDSQVIHVGSRPLCWYSF